jgi:pseudouridine synthase
MEKQVLQKFIADSGLCSRRKAGELIKNGKVKVNGELAELGQKAGSNDRVEVNGKEIGLAKEKIYIKLNKPKGYVCTNRQFKDEKNVFDLINIKERLFVVGRLDKNSRGLLLLTNDGELTQKLTHPKFEHEKIYEVKIRKQKPDKKEIENILNNFKKGIDIGESDGVVSVRDIKYLGNSNFLIVLTGGKKRQIRRMFKLASYGVDDLIRTGIESLTLGDLKQGEWKYLNENEVKDLIRVS